VELVEEVLTLLLQVLDLLKLNFKLPLSLLVTTFNRLNFGSDNVQLGLDFQVDQLFLLKLVLFGFGLV
jgi:hypothetical protein